MFKIKQLIMNEADPDLLGGGGSPDPSGGNPDPAGGGNPDPGEADTAWLQNIDEEYRSDPALKVFKNATGLAKSYINAQKMIGQKGIIKPGKDASDEEWSAFYNHFRGDDFEKYEVNKGESKVDDEYFADFKKAAYDAGLSPKQAESLFNHNEKKIGEAQQKFQEKMAEHQNAQIESLKGEWGNDFDARLRIANQAMVDISEEAGIDMVKHLKEIGMQNDVTLIKFLYQAGKATLEDGTTTTHPQGSMGMAVEEAEAKYNAYMSDYDGPYHNKSHADHSRVVKEMGKLLTIMNSRKK